MSRFWTPGLIFVFLYWCIVARCSSWVVFVDFPPSSVLVVSLFAVARAALPHHRVAMSMRASYLLPGLPSIPEV
jgi:hypothetical protein